MARKRVKLAPPVKKNQKRKQKVARNEEVYDDKSNKTIVDASVLSKATMLELAGKFQNLDKGIPITNLISVP